MDYVVSLTFIGCDCIVFSNVNDLFQNKSINWCIWSPWVVTVFVFSNVNQVFFNNSRLIRRILHNKIYKNIQRLNEEFNPDCLLSATLTIKLKCFLLLYETIIDLVILSNLFYSFNNKMKISWLKKTILKYQKSNVNNLHWLKFKYFFN